MDISKIKLIIWDLDETLWQGTLSDNTHKIIPANIELIKKLVDNGVVCSICSKNEHSQVEELLKSLGIWDLFVFNSINWSPKGERVKQIIEEMQLRAPNVLFIDDNNLNLEEAKNACSEIMIESPECIKELVEYFNNVEPKDLQHKRLNQYKILERKKEFKAKLGSNVEFLKKSNIKVAIKTDCINHLDRLEDLILRSNQLNFTKVRSSKQEIEVLVNNPNIKCGYVEVKDDFGDYGIVGFYAVQDEKLLHFVFSCRTLNMGIEQYVYNQIGRPELNMVGEVASNPTIGDYFWINQQLSNRSKKCKDKMAKKLKMVIKGPCDMSQLFSYIEPSNNIITEFVYVNDKGVSIEQHNHTSHIIQSTTLSSEKKKELSSSLPFGDDKMYETQIFDKDVDFVVLSLFTDPNLGLYKNKVNGAIVAFGEYLNDLTNEENWDSLINKDVFVANCEFTKENLKYIKDNYTYEGRLTPAQVASNVKTILSGMQPQAKLILVLGSETEYLQNNQKSYRDRHLYNKELNKIIREFAEQEKRIVLLDVNNYIEGQNSFTNNINHFTKDIYFKLSKELISLVDGGVQKRSILTKLIIKTKTFMKKVIRKIKKLGR